MVPPQFDLPSEPITVLLPMRNESLFAAEKISEVIEEVSEKNAKILVIDSASTDNTSEEVQNAMLESNFPDERWDLIRMEEPGKSRLINLALEMVPRGLIVMSDADARGEKGWLYRFTEYFSDPRVGFVSGIISPRELTSEKTLESSYKKSSQKMRVRESSASSTIIAEGSLCCFRRSAIGENRLNVKFNADDTQLSIICIRNNFQSLIAENIFFSDRNNHGYYSRTSRRIRRGRGVVRTLLSNSDLIFPSRNRINPGVFLKNLLFFLLLPWLVLSTIFLVVILPSSHILPSFVIERNTYFFILAILSSSLLSGFVRSLIEGSLILIVSQLSIPFHNGMDSWTPIR